MAGNSTVKIFIQGDAGGVSRAARDAERSLSRLHGRASSAFRGMSEVAGGFGLAMGAQGVLGAVQDSVKAYQESEKSGARMAAQLETLGANTEAYRKQIDDAIQAQSKFGAFDDEDLQDSFTKLVRSTGDVRKALELNNLVMDIARGRGVDLATAADAVAKAAAGNTGALRRMGVQVEKGASAQDALAQAQAKYAGQAKQYGETNAAAADRASIAWENAQEQFGERAAQAFAIGSRGAQQLAEHLDDVVDAAGGLQGLAAGGGAFLAVSKLGPAAVSASHGFAAMRREIELTSRIRTGQLDVFNIASRRIDTSATTKNIRAAYREIGQTISTAQAGALAKGERIAAPIGRLGAIAGVARRAGSSLVGLAGGPMGIAAVAATGLALGLAKVTQEMTTAEEEARDAAQAIKELGDAQLDAQGAALDVEQAELNLGQARNQSRNALSQLHQAEAGMRRVRKQHLEDTPRGAAAEAKYRRAVDNSRQAELDLAQAHHRVAVARQNQQTADAAVVASSQKMQKEFGGLTDKARELGAQYTLDAIHAGNFHARMRQGAFEAKAYADLIIEAANSNESFTQANKATAAEIANVVRQMDHTPSKKEIELITNAVTTKGDMEELKRQLGLIPASTPANVSSNADAVTNRLEGVRAAQDRIRENITVTITQVFRQVGSWFNTPTSATGSMIAGAFDGRDNVPVMVSRGEVILNPQQIGMIGAHRVYGALRATGAPTIVPGGGYRGGGASKKEPVNTIHRTPRQTWQQRLARAQAQYDAAFNALDMQLADAEHTSPIGDDNVVRAKMRRLIERRIRDLRAMAGSAPSRYRTEMYGEIASLTRSLDQYGALTPDTGGGGSEPPVDTSDLEARLRQAEARATAAERNLGLSEAAFGTLGGYGRGAGRATTVVNVQSIFPPTPDQYRQGAAFMSDAFGRQSYRRTPRIRIGA